MTYSLYVCNTRQDYLKRLECISQQFWLLGKPENVFGHNRTTLKHVEHSIQWVMLITFRTSALHIQLTLCTFEFACASHFSVPSFGSDRSVASTLVQPFSAREQCGNIGLFRRSTALSGLSNRHHIAFGVVEEMSATLPCCTLMTGYAMPECSSQAAATCRGCWTDFQQHGGVSAVLRVVLKQRYRHMTNYVSFQTYDQRHTSRSHSAQPLLQVAVHFHIRLVHPIHRLLQSMELLPACLEHLGIHVRCSAISEDWFVHMFAAMPKRLKMLTLDVSRKASVSRFGRPID